MAKTRDLDRWALVALTLEMLLIAVCATLIAVAVRGALTAPPAEPARPTEAIEGVSAVTRDLADALSTLEGREP